MYNCILLLEIKPGFEIRAYRIPILIQHCFVINWPDGVMNWNLQGGEQAETQRDPPGTVVVPRSRIQPGQGPGFAVVW
ncbi:MAG TPA: hypothetical protein PLU80_09680 [Acidobacteriota bacterium]|nr:hypothetical protein [Acidobacteriota bacterium]